MNIANTHTLSEAQRKELRNNKIKRSVAHTFMYIGLAILCVLFLFPIVWMVVNSLKTHAQVYENISNIKTFLPATWDVTKWFKSYGMLFNTFEYFGRSIINSIVYTGVTILGVLLINSFAGYALARIKFPGRNFLVNLILIILMVPVETSIVPLYVILSKLGLLQTNTRVIGYLIPSFVSPYYIFMFRSFFMGIPKEIEEAAGIDGAGRFKIFFKLIFPISLPVFATVGIFTFMGAWNDYVFAQLMFSNPAQQPLQVFLQLINNFNPKDISLTMAALTFSTIPIALVYIFCQRYIVEGVSFGGLKQEFLMKLKNIFVISCVLCLLLAVFCSCVERNNNSSSGEQYSDPHQENAIFHLDFDENENYFVNDQINGEVGEINYVFKDAKFKENEKNAQWITSSAVKGSCLAFDGYSTYITYPNVQTSGSKLTVEVFVSPRAFEWDEPLAIENGRESLQVIVGKYDKEASAGFVLGMHKYGEWSFQVGTDKGWFKLWNEWNNLDKYTWNHLTAVYDGEEGYMAVYKNGEIVNEMNIEKGCIKQCDAPLYVGKSANPQYTGVYQLNMFNGLMDDLKIYSQAKSAEEVEKYHKSFTNEKGKLPTVSFTDGWLNPYVLQDDIYRPSYHALPPQHWMNEPHALFFYNGYYHLFYQFNLTGPYWRQICWGHWVSPDMVNWKHVKEAIVMDESSPAPDGIWSGNASYKKDGTPVLFITAGNDSRDENPYSNQNIAIAVPKDLNDPYLTDWVLSDSSVVTLNESMGAPNEFRDPNVYYEDGVYYMVISGRLKNERGTAFLYTTEDDSFTNWTYRGTLFTPEVYEPYMGQTWELVNLVKLKNQSGTQSKYLFAFSPAGANSDNDVYYYLGDFNKKTYKFIPETQRPMLMDYGNNVFTGPTITTLPNTGEVVICSIIQDQRSGRDEYNAGWAHSAGMPRKLSLTDEGNLAISPVSTITNLYGETLFEEQNLTVSQINQKLKSGFGSRLYISFQIEIGNANEIGLQFKSNGKNSSKLGYNAINGTLYIDTTNSGSQRVKGVFGGELQTPSGVLQVDMYIDNAMVECYINGEKTITAMIYNDSDGLQFFGEGCLIKSCKIIKMNAIKW